ncbi:MAG: DUF5989 family protein [Planctomycetota bacterium]|nr:DUF5989 family protein [Planctomycetota bacterium]
MRSINVALCFVVSFLLALAVAEVGLRLLGLGPQPTIHRFDPDTGWSKKPDTTAHKKTSEFDITIATNQFGLRDDPMTSAAKPAGTKRVLVLGDSFALGYTVDRDDLFVDLLERWWKAEGRPLDVVNTGTEGWSTDQEAVWLEKNGAAFQPDVVLLFPYENDLYWNGEMAYLRFPKPRYSVTGPRELRVLPDPGETAWYERTAVGKFLTNFGGERRTWTPDGSGRALEMEYGAYWRTPPDFMTAAIRRTRSGFAAVKKTCDAIGAELVVVPIPGKASIVAEAREKLEGQILSDDPISALRRKLKGQPDPATIPSLAPDKAWSPDQPVETFLSLARELSIRTVDVRPAFRAREDAVPKDEQEELLYHKIDWHLNPAGNRALAEAIHAALDTDGVLAGDLAARHPAAIEADRHERPTRRWPFWYAGLVLVLGTLYARSYRDVATWKAYAITAGMLGLVFTIAVGGASLVAKLPPALGRPILIAFVLGILLFVLLKLGRRLSTILELLAAFTRRGHWYLMPLVVILLTIGSLLVVAASSPLVAPFIYTLF